MSKSGQKQTRKKPADWQRARDLVAAGRLSLREIAKEIGVPPATLRYRKKKEEWYDPHKEADSIPPPPPKLKNKSNCKRKSDTSAEDMAKALLLTDAPDREKYQDLLTWCQELLAWALAGVSKHARNSFLAQQFLIEKLPNVMKSLAIAGQKGGSKEEEAEEFRKEFEDRFKKIQKPAQRKFDLGEIPAKQTVKDNG